MTVSVSSHKNRRHKKYKEYLFIFENSENMILGILFLYRLKHYFKSMLYKTEKDYRLIVKAKEYYPCFISLCDFCKSHSRNVIDTAYTKEYGKLLISENAVKTLGKHFLKRP